MRGLGPVYQKHILGSTLKTGHFKTQASTSAGANSHYMYISRSILLLYASKIGKYNLKTYPKLVIFF